eukprot:TRINITY_DN2363_c5_g1_i1.p1 TRINITY_DN2363_c5_g1~~TRINITY_DN2363_c5_g1_i1.p1  ORF type:complete len:526 (+),score=97.99 TRINITY_DN2363_c5_g1_i1:59-1579(+)
MTRALKSLVDQIEPITRPFGYQDVQEELTAAPCTVEGQLPGYIAGTLYRQAGGAFHENATLLDGLAHIVGWEIKNGKVLFSNKFIQSEAYRAMLSGVRGWENTVSYKKVDAKLVKQAGKGGVTDGNINVNIWLLGDKQIAAASEFPEGEVVLVDPKTLATKKALKTLPGKDVFNKPFGKVFTTSAHYLYDPSQDGDYHVSTYLKMISPKGDFESGYTIFKGRDTFPMQPFTTFPLKQFNWGAKKNAPMESRPSYMHSMAVSQKHVVAIETSKKLNFDTLNGGAAFFQMYEFQDSVPTRFIIWDKETGKQVGQPLQGKTPGMLFHVSNCFEEGSKITIDISYANCDSLVKTPTVEGIMRYEIDLESGHVSETIASKEVFEFPCCNPKFLGCNYRYMYGVSNAEGDHGPLTMWNIKKVDLQSGKHTHWDLPSGWTASEPQFVPNPSSTREDDGTLLVPSINQSLKTTAVVALDASTMKEIARIINPITVNFGLHNCFVPEEIDRIVKL